MIDNDPLFVLPEKRDYRLLWGSPCIDTGHPGPQYNDPDGTRCDMGSHCFNQDNYLTLYLTPDAMEMLPGDVLGVTYTVINRWYSPESCWLLSQALLPGGNSVNILGPYPYIMPPDALLRFHLIHDIPIVAPTGMYEYRSMMGMPPGTLYDSDNFKFWVVE
jgi:hypothetical protein